MKKFAPIGAALLCALTANTAHAAVFVQYFDDFAERADNSGIDFNGSPFQTETVSAINFAFPGTGAPPSAENPFAALLTGKFDVAAAGTYDFTLSSDDGSYLFIDGALVGSLPNDHPEETGIFGKTLTAGLHDFRIEYYNGPQTVATLRLDLADGVSIAAAAVPEPATWLMMAAGFGLAGFALRRRRAERTTVRVSYA